MIEYMIPISNRIASEIKRTGLTQQEVGKMLGVSHKAVSRWCSANKGISIKHFMQLCLLLDCSADYILFGGEALSAQPERKRGKWLEEDIHSNWSDWTLYVCSECGKLFKDLEVRKFCPNCGAEMEGEV